MFRATSSFVWGDRFIYEGQVYATDDPAVVRFGHLFEAVEAVAYRNAEQVEAATAAPGEKRRTVRR